MARALTTASKANGTGMRPERVLRWPLAPCVGGEPSGCSDLAHRVARRAASCAAFSVANSHRGRCHDRKFGI